MTDDSNSRGKEILAKIRAQSDWAELRAQVLEASVLKGIGRPLVKIGRFDAIVCIGEGGFGTVFRARDPKLGRLVALKLCRTRSSDVVEGIMNEAMALAQLEHANIVTIFELGEHDGGVFFAMRYLAGKNAERFAERDPPPTCKEILKVYCHVARGLAAAHTKKYVHGDIKPSNILLDADDFAYIADFGLARRMIDDADESEREELRRRGGTMYYMAPEVLAGGRCDARSDQFSFFVALSQTLSGGELPFCGKSSGEVLEAIKQTDILQFLGPWVPAELKAVIRIGLSIDPSDRFPDMETVEAELERVLQTAPPSSPPRGELEFDEPESDESESDGPERMHEPERSDETALMLGEPEARGGEPPSHEPGALVGESRPVELMPLGGGPVPSHAKRGARVLSASLVLTVGVTLGWLGRARVEGPRPSDDPVPLPSSPCALGDAEGSSVDINPAVIAACTYIRQGELGEANKYWDVIWTSRRDVLKKPGPHNEDSPEKLAADTMIVVQTYRDEAERLARQPGGQEVAKEAIHWANEWNPFVAYSRALGDANGSTGELSNPSVETTN